MERNNRHRHLEEPGFMPPLEARQAYAMQKLPELSIRSIRAGTRPGYSNELPKSVIRSPLYWSPGIDRRCTLCNVTFASEVKALPDTKRHQV